MSLKYTLPRNTGKGYRGPRFGVLELKRDE
jgi:hypothetical protein